MVLNMDRKQIAVDFAKSLNHPEIVKIILFGSVARDEDTEDSDIDILIITSKKQDKRIIGDDVYDKVIDVLIKTGEHISVKIKHDSYYTKYKDFSFFSNVNKDGILIH
ncbi:nucleotidyltransferase domain-containing protein [Methanobrevibacter filiformis]|uniref:protein adenylyltransferase n=1 Tax=Methanobrevibacter filiformis TaxID=55758 RepID=A0A166AZU6_9EURY|nr:nucleotidyltransferase domain-containing protein [Methanobrevibacter filiformis]KZX12683.1 nucleotidyltransferase domain protein [Methanobrevibacter filiformis]